MASSRARQFAQGAHCHLLPSKHNDYVPHTLRHRVLFGYSVILVLVKVLVMMGYVLLPVASVYSSAVTAKNIIALTNATRGALGHDVLEEDSRLGLAALGKAEDMVVQQYFAHTGPDGRTPWDWIRGAGYDYLYAGENLAVHYFTAEEAHDGWLASPEHRRNIADGRFTEVGVGVARGTYAGFDTVFVVEMFGHPKAAEAAAADTSEDEPEIADTTEMASETMTATVAAVEGVQDESPVQAAVVEPVPDSVGEYQVAVQAPTAQEVTALLGQSSAELEPDDTGDTWSGRIQTDNGSTGEEELLIRVEDRTGVTVEPVMTVLPQASTQEVFTLEDQRQPFRLFGLLEIHDLRDTAFRFYVTVAILLGALLLLSVLVKFEIQRHSVNAHVLMVMILSLALAFI